MDNAQRTPILVGLRMRVGEAPSHAARDKDGILHGKDPSLLLQLSAKLLQVHAPDQFHRNEEAPGVLTQMIGLNDVGMDQVGDQLGFANKVLNKLRLRGKILANDLDRDALEKLLGSRLLSLVNNSHPALKYFADDVIPDLVLNSEKDSHKPDVPSSTHQVKTCVTTRAEKGVIKSG